MPPIEEPSIEEADNEVFEEELDIGDDSPTKHDENDHHMGSIKLEKNLLDPN
jgi:hypothetical protein